MDAAKAFYGEAWWSMSKADKLAAIEKGIRNPEHFHDGVAAVLPTVSKQGGGRGVQQPALSHKEVSQMSSRFRTSPASTQRSATHSTGSPSPSASRSTPYSPLVGAGGRRYSSAEESFVGTSREVESADLAQWTARAGGSSLKCQNLIAEGLETLTMLDSHRVERHDVSIAAMRRMTTTQEQYTEQLRARDREHEEDLAHISDEIMGNIAHMKGELHSLQSRYVEELARLEQSFAKDREHLLVSNRAQIRKCVDTAAGQTAAANAHNASARGARVLTRHFSPPCGTRVLTLRSSANSRPHAHSRAHPRTFFSRFPFFLHI